jgi:hypothetical protein
MRNTKGWTRSGDRFTFTATVTSLGGVPRNKLGHRIPLGAELPDAVQEWNPHPDVLYVGDIRWTHVNDATGLNVAFSEAHFEGFHLTIHNV